jgi:hypothetical protein
MLTVLGVSSLGSKLLCNTGRGALDRRALFLGSGGGSVSGVWIGLKLHIEISIDCLHGLGVEGCGMVSPSWLLCDGPGLDACLGLLVVVKLKTRQLLGLLYSQASRMA